MRIRWAAPIGYWSFPASDGVNPLSVELDAPTKAGEFLYVGRNVRRVDSLEKVCGMARYLEDMVHGNVLYAKTLRSTVPHGRIRSVDLGDATSDPEVVGFVDIRDVPGEKLIGYIPEMPVFASGKTRYVGEPILLAIATNQESAADAVGRVRVEIEPLPYVTDVFEALRSSQVLVDEAKGTNLAFRMKIGRGNVREAMEGASAVVENEYKISARDHAYIEREGALAIPDEKGRFTVYVQNQNPHAVQMNVARVLGVDRNEVTVIQPAIGGSFGGKNDMGILLASQAAVAAHKVARPVLLSLSREESLVSHTKSESGTVRFVSAASAKGDLLSADVRVTFDSGAYAVRSPAILWRTVMEVVGPYYVPNAEIEGTCVYTNKVYMGALRGFGTPTAAFASEMQMEALASKLGLDPIEFRLKNLVRPGSATVSGQVIDDAIDFEQALRRVMEASDWKKRRQSYAIQNRGAGLRRGIGVGCAWHGISVGWGYGGKAKSEISDWSAASVTLSGEGLFTIQTGIVEMGQGTSTALTQVAAETLGVPMDRIVMKTGSTNAPDTGGTHASRGLTIGGLAVVKACQEIRDKIRRVGSEAMRCAPDEVVMGERGVSRRNGVESVRWASLLEAMSKRGEPSEVQVKVKVPRGEFDPETGQGHAFPTYTFTATVAEVEVDSATGDVVPVKLWPAVSAGRIVNPTAAREQVLGGIVFGIGGALLEEVMFDAGGRVTNPFFSTYLLPTMGDTPEISEPIFIEDVSKYGAFGAKGIGEISSSGVTPAIASAIYHATGVVMTETPLSKERVWRRLGGIRK